MISILLINFNVFKYRAIFYSVIVFYQLKKRNWIHFGTVMLLVTYRIPIKSSSFFAGLKFTLREELYNYE